VNLTQENKTLSSWNAFQSELFAQCRSLGIKPWVGNPSSWASALYQIQKATLEEKDTRRNKFVTVDDIPFREELPEECIGHGMAYMLNPEECLIVKQHSEISDDLEKEAARRLLTFKRAQRRVGADKLRDHYQTWAQKQRDALLLKEEADKREAEKPALQRAHERELRESRRRARERRQRAYA
jgi:hypothetical protein